jgi:hypothetical protein
VLSSSSEIFRFSHHASATSPSFWYAHTKLKSQALALHSERSHPLVDGMSYCRVHGSFSDSEDGCPACRAAEERAEADRAATLEQISELAWRTRNPGEFECPHCKYIALKRQASRCPLCHGTIDSHYWVLAAKRERAAAAAAGKSASEPNGKPLKLDGHGPREGSMHSSAAPMQ